MKIFLFVESLNNEDENFRISGSNFSSENGSFIKIIDVTLLTYRIEHEWMLHFQGTGVCCVSLDGLFSIWIYFEKIQYSDF